MHFYLLFLQKTDKQLDIAKTDTDDPKRRCVRQVPKSGVVGKLNMSRQEWSRFIDESKNLQTREEYSELIKKIKAEALYVYRIIVKELSY